jgi:hypothetical protein
LKNFVRMAQNKDLVVVKVDITHLQLVDNG